MIKKIAVNCVEWLSTSNQAKVLDATLECGLNRNIAMCLVEEERSELYGVIL